MELRYLNAMCCHAAILSQKQEGFFRIRIALIAGDMSAATAEAIASIAQRYGIGEIRCTPRHEVEIPFVRPSCIEAMLKEVESLGLRIADLCERPNVVACPGADQCPKAYVKRKRLCADIDSFLTERAQRGGTAVPIKLRIALSGCPNECSHARVNDIGLVGSIITQSSRRIRGFEIFLGGSHDGSGVVAEQVAFVSPEDVIPTIRDLLEIYGDTAQEGMTFSEMLLDLGIDEIVARLQNKLSQRIWFYDI